MNYVVTNRTTFLKLFDIVNTWPQSIYKIIKYRNKCVKWTFFSGQTQTNPVTTSQANNGLFVAGISSLVIALITTIFVISLLVFCRKF